MLSDYDEDDTMKRNKNIHTAAIGMLCLATLMTGACVTQRTYEVANADLDAAKSELQSARAETQGLDQQVNNLQQRKKDLANQMVVASMALDQATKEMKAERTTSQKRLSSLNQTIKHLAAEQKSLRDGFKRATKHRATLQSTVDNYTAQLRPVDERNAPPIPPPAVATNQPVNTTLVPSAQTPVPNEPVPKPTVAPTAVPVNQPVANPILPRGGQPPEPVEEDWLTFFKNWISSLWQSVFF